MKLKITTSASADTVTHRLSGAITENSTALLKLPLAAEVVLDWAGVAWANSSGIRLWAEALMRMDRSRVFYDNVPSSLVETITSIPFLSAKVTIRSFQAVFNCRACGAETEHRLVADAFEPTRPCPKCRAPLATDALDEVYLAFLNRC